MSLVLSRLLRPRLGRSALCLLSNGFSSSSLQSPPCTIVGASWLGDGLGKLIIDNANERDSICFPKKVPLDLVYNRMFGYSTVTIGSSHGWVATLKDDGILRLQDDLNPVASDSEPKRIPMPPLVALPHCQTKIVTNVSMSSPSPEDEDCVVAVKFLGPQLSFCRPAHSNSEWTNIEIENRCFFSPRVMFCKKDEMFHILGFGGQLIGSWDLHKLNEKPKLQILKFQNSPKLTETKRELLDSCCTTQHLVESQSTGETFLVKWYKKTAEIRKGIAKMKTEAVMVFKLDEEVNAVHTQDIGDLSIFLSESEPFCVPASSFPGLSPNYVNIYDADEVAYVDVAGLPVISRIASFSAPYYIPPQNIVQ